MNKISSDYPIRGVCVRKALKKDTGSLLSLIDALAAYEKLTPPDESAKQRLLRDVFGKRPRIEAYLAVIEDQTVGYAIIIETYSSFLALPTLYLEDIFVLPEFRKRKAGLALFLAMTTLAKERGCGRMEWTVLNWNKLAIDFYEQIGGRQMKEWLLYRLSDDDLQKLPRIEIK